MARQRILPDWISVDRESPEPLYRQIARRIENAVDQERLTPGTYLPATRSLAAHLGVSRLTVLSAYELLVADGLLETIAGSGTRVPEDLLGSGLAPSAGARAGAGAENEMTPGAIGNRPSFPVEPVRLPKDAVPLAFRTGIPALDLFPRRVWSRLLRRHGLRGDPYVLDYGHRGGYRPLREMIARYLTHSRGLPCAPAQVIVVGSVRAAISVGCSVLSSWGDTAVWGDPGYRWARASMEVAGLEVAPVAVDDEGLRAGDLVDQAADARIVYVTPSHHWPTGVILSPGRRAELLDWARKRRGWILEDDYDSEFHFDGPPNRPLKAEPDSEQVIFIGTFAKTMAPAIRCAYLVVPECLEERFSEHATYLGIEPAVHVQAALADFMNEGYFTRYIQQMRKVYHARRDALEQALTETLGNRIAVRHPAGGLQLIADLRGDISAEAVSVRAARRDIMARPMSIYYDASPPPNALHLGFAPVPESQIAPAVRRLAAMIDTIG